MDREHVKGFAENTKVAVKEGAGKLSGAKRFEKSAAHDAAGNVKDAARDAADALTVPLKNTAIFDWAAFGQLSLCLIARVVG